MLKDVQSLKKKQLLRERVYTSLRAEILTWGYPPGSKIIAAEVAGHYGVSKSPVRDALMRLERENLVITAPRQGYFVAPVSLPDVQDMFFLRSAIESAVMTRIVRLASDEELKGLDSFRVFRHEDWQQGFVSYNYAFHEHLAELSKSSRILDVLRGLLDHLGRAVLVSVGNTKAGNDLRLAGEHTKLVDALQGRNLKQAQRLIEKHISDAAKRVDDAVSSVNITTLQKT